MKPLVQYGLALLLAIAMAGRGIAATSGELLQQALYSEEIEGDLPAAIAQYEAIVGDSASDRTHVAQALYRGGMCCLRLKDDPGAVAMLSKLVTDFADEAALVAKAQSVLEEIRFFDPADLMPPDTLVYLEMGSPGEQIETILQMVKGTPLENPLEALTEKASKDSPNVNLNGVAVSVLNPVMLEEFKKIESFAIGVQGTQQPNPDFVAAINLGENNILRGLLLTTISIATRPGPVIGGVQTFVIPDNEGMIACDEKVYFIASSSEQLMWSLKQYTHQSIEASLATSNPSFRSMDKRVRQGNLATLWVDADALLSQILPTDPSEEDTFMPSPFIIMAAEGTDDLLLTASLATNAVTFDAQVNFKDGMSNPLYEMIRTPTLSKAGFSAVPSDAVALATLVPPKANSALIQHLALSLQDDGLIEQLNLLLENVEQISLFALPGRRDMLPTAIRPVFAVACSDPVTVSAALRSLLARFPDIPQLRVEEADGFVFAGLEKYKIEAARSALAKHTSVNEGGVLADVVEKHAGQVQKLISVNGNGIFEAFLVMLALENSLSPEEGSTFYAADYAQQMNEISKHLQSTELTIYTDEQPQTLSLHAELTGIPPLSELIPSVISIQQVMDGIEQQTVDRAAAQMELEKLQILIDINNTNPPENE